jgi:hypothetical protein
MSGSDKLNAVENRESLGGAEMVFLHLRKLIRRNPSPAIAIVLRPRLSIAAIARNESRRTGKLRGSKESDWKPV